MVLCVALWPQQPDAPADAPGAAHLIGRLVTADGTALGRGAVTLLSPGWTEVAGAAANSVAVEQDGAFRLELPVGQTGFEVFVEAPNRASWVLSATSPVAAGEVRDLGDIALIPGVTLIGRVRDPDGRGVAGAEVRAVDMCRARAVVGLVGRRRDVRAVTDAAGIFRLPGVPRSGVELSCSAQGHGEGRISAVVHGAPLEFVLRPADALSGRVEGAPFAGPLELLAEDGASTRVSIGADGAFTAWAAPGLRHRLRWSPPGAAPVWSEGLDGPQDGIVLRAGAASGTPEPQPRVHELRVVGPRGDAVAAFSVVAAWSVAADLEAGLFYGRRGPVVRGVDGAAALDVPASWGPGRGALIVRAPGLGEAIVGVERRPEDGPQRVVLHPEAVVAGRVVDGVGAPLADARVWAVPVANGSLAYGYTPPGVVHTDREGRFRIGGLAARRYGVQVAPPPGAARLAPPAQIVDLQAPGETRTLEDVALSDPVPLALSATGPSGADSSTAGWILEVTPNPAPAGTRFPDAVWTGQRLAAHHPLRPGMEWAPLVAPTATRIVAHRHAPGRVPFVEAVVLAELERAEPEPQPVVLDPSVLRRGVFEGQVALPADVLRRVAIVALRSSRFAADDDPPAALPDAGGRFRLELGPGPWTLGVRDLETDLDLWQEPAARDLGLGDVVEVALAPEVPVVQLEVRPPAGRPCRVARQLRITVRSGGWRRRVATVDLGRAEELPPLLLPLGEVELELRRPGRPCTGNRMQEIAAQVLVDVTPGPPIPVVLEEAGVGALPQPESGSW